MKISYIILTWNSEKYIKKCLDSILNIQQFNNNIIVIDNGSTDSTCKILKKYEPTIKNIFLDKNIGTTKSRNIGIKNIDKDSDYICILDSDTQINCQAINKLVNTLKNNEIGIVGPKMITSSGVIQKSGRKFPTIKIKMYKAFPSKKIQQRGEKLESYNFNNNKDTYEVDYLMSACWLMRKEILEKIGFLDENIFYAPEDVDYCARVWQAGYKVIFCKDAQIIHEWQRISKKKFISKINLEHIKGLTYYFIKYKYLNNSNKIYKKK